MLEHARHLARTTPAEFRELLPVIARDGDLDVVRALHADGLLASMEAKSAILRLPLFAKDQQAALDLVREIISVRGKLTSKVAASHFSFATTVGAIQVLDMLGCDPNQWMAINPLLLETPLSKQIGKIRGRDNFLSGELNPILAILDILRERNVLPLTQKNRFEANERNLFQSIATAAVDANNDLAYRTVIEKTSALDWPDSWQRAAASAIEEVFPNNHPILVNWQAQLMAGLMSKAKFDDAGMWKRMFDLSANSEGLVANMGRWLAYPTVCGDSGVAVARNMVAHGVQIDEIAVELPTDTCPSAGTLLHSAIIMKNLPMIEVLIGGGASPDAVVSKHPRHPANGDVGLCSVELAEKFFHDALPLLHAARAKNAIARTLDRASMARTAGSQETPP